VPIGFNVIEAERDTIRVFAKDCDGGVISDGRCWALPRRKPHSKMPERHQEPVVVTPDGKAALDPTVHETTPS
jgi:hypothetical protein